MRLAELTPALMNQAIEIYLSQAYSNEEGRDSHRVVFSDEDGPKEILARLEREDASAGSYSLRLGSESYPHMKLALWEAYFAGEYIFAVDRHDGFDFDQDLPNYEEWAGVKSKNYLIKATVEEGWYQAKLPTLRSLKEKRLSQSDLMREFSGHNVLVVENDHDAGVIVQTILSSAGYGCIYARSVAEALAVLEDPKEAGRCGLALIDLILDDGSGVEVVKAIRQGSATQDMPILISSAMNQSGVHVKAADMYLRKPYTAEEMLARVAETIRRRYDGHETFLQ